MDSQIVGISGNKVINQPASFLPIRPILNE